VDVLKKLDQKETSWRLGLGGDSGAMSFATTSSIISGGVSPSSSSNEGGTSEGSSSMIVVRFSDVTACLAAGTPPAALQRHSEG